MGGSLNHQPEAILNLAQLLFKLMGSQIRQNKLGTQVLQSLPSVFEL
jgi:hypothetical protein